MNSEIIVSVIIPTHNRPASLKRLLQKLAMQTYPLEGMEVIAVANSCTDDTVALLQQYKAPFQLRYAETSGSGPAVPRNKGAAMAEGRLLIFLDDDVDPSEELVEAFVEAHRNENTVVIGYLPLLMGRNAGFFRLSLRNWWEKKFESMRRSGYRFTYEDVFSGNCSLPAALFKKAGGFITSINCRDDYELGLRLIKLEAEFCFSEKACALHRDEVTDLQRSLKRKREEGKTDVKLWRMHPDLTTGLQDAYVKGEYTFMQSKTVFMLTHWPALTDSVANLLFHFMNGLERFKLRSPWKELSYKLHLYWYFRGMIEELHTKENLKNYLTHRTTTVDSAAETEIDLKEGLRAAELKLDELRPASLRVRYGGQTIGFIPFQPGAERLRGIHLRPLLAKKLSKEISRTIMVQKMSEPSLKLV